LCIYILTVSVVHFPIRDPTGFNGINGVLL